MVTQKKQKKNFMVWKKSTKSWDVDVNNIAILKLAKTKPNSKYLIGYLDEVKMPLVFISLKMSGYTKFFKVTDKDNKVVPSRVEYDKLFKK